MKSLNLRSVFLVFLVFTAIHLPSARAQFFTAGQDPASVVWSQIRTENFQVIFPEEFLSQARYVADILEFAYTHGGNTLGHRPRRIPVILHNRTVIPNGFVSWAPRRIEIYNNPSQANDAHDWFESIAIHEFRHVVQIDKLNQGITRILNILLGEQATGIVLGLYVPLWFLEGDAVATETSLTYSGRGRLPRFEQGLRAQVLQKGAYSFDKAVFGSYRDHVPNHYELGYQLVASARAQYGAQVWDGVITNVARRPYSITPFSSGLKKQSGAGKVDHYRQTFSYLDSAWTHQRQQHQYTSFAQINSQQKLFTSYRHLSFVDEQTLVALKTSLADIPQVVSIDVEGNERLLFYPGFYNAYAFSAAAGLITWSEVRRDPRWEHRSWSEIFVYDMSSGQRKRITRQSRYFSPSLSSDGRRIVAAEVTELNEYNLVILDAQNGEVIQRLSAAGNSFLMTPSWHGDGKQIIAITLDEQGKSIVAIDPASETFTTLWGPSHVEISRPVYQGDQVIFNAAFNGIDNIYRLDPGNGSISMIISSEFGAVDAAFSPGGQHVVWSDYNAMGYQIALADASIVDQALELDLVEDHSVKFYQVLAAQEPATATVAEIPRNDFEPEPYYRLGNLFHLHSWGPFALDVNNVEANPGASLFLQNHLSTSFASLGYEYDVNDETGRYYLNYSYHGWYPVVDLQAETSLRTAYYSENQRLIPFPYRDNRMLLGLSVPLAFRHQEYGYGVIPFLRTGIIQTKPVEGSPRRLRDNNMWNMEYRLVAYRQRFSVRRDMRPRWGQTLDVNYRHTPFGGGDMGYVFASRIIGLFPGLMNHHSLMVSAAFQKRERGQGNEPKIYYSFPNLINFPRGISGQAHEQLISFSADYALPLFYPDWSLPPFLYLQRVSMNLFTDYALAEQMVTAGNNLSLQTRNFHTMGFDITGNMHLFRFFNPISAGGRFILRPATGQVQMQLIWGIRF